MGREEVERARYFLKKEGVVKLTQSHEGRKLLSTLQEHHKIDLLQPSDPLFEKYYGAQRKRQAEALRRKEDASRAIREEHEAKKKK